MYKAIMADLIAIATSGGGGLSRFAFGTVADEVTRKSPCSLLVFHPKHVRSVVTAGEGSVGETLAGVESVGG